MESGWQKLLKIRWEKKKLLNLPYSSQWANKNWAIKVDHVSCVNGKIGRFFSGNFCHRTESLATVSYCIWFKSKKWKFDVFCPSCIWGKKRQRHGIWYSAAYQCAVVLYNLGSGSWLALAIYSTAAQASSTHCSCNGLWTRSYAARCAMPQSATLGIHPIIHVSK